MAALERGGEREGQREILCWTEEAQDEAAPWLIEALARRCPDLARRWEASPGWRRALLHERRLGPRWRLVRVLDLRELPLSYVHLRALVEALELEGLRELDLSGVPLRQRGAALLASARFAPSLEVLRLASCSLWPQAVEALLGGEGMPALVELDLSSNPIGPRGSVALARTDRLPALELLRLPEDAKTPRAQEALRCAPQRHLTNAVARFPLLRDASLWGVPPTRLDDHARFGTLRALLGDSPSTTRWVQICALLELWPPARREEITPYIEQLATRWPDRDRALPQGWLELDGNVPTRVAPHAALCRAITIRGGVYKHVGEELDLSNAASLAALLNHEAVGPLTVMCWRQPMRHALIRDDALNALARHPWRELYLERAMFQHERDRVLELLCAPWTRDLEILGLLDARRTLDADHREALRALGHHLPRLHTLVIDGLQARLDALDTLADADPEVFPALTHIVLPPSWRDRPNVRALERHPRLRALLRFEPLDARVMVSS